jgi:hypothetical protein
MAEEPVTPSGWLPPVAPSSRPAEPVSPPPGERPARPAFVREKGARPRAPGSTANPQAVWALVLGGGSLALLVVSLGTFFLVTLPCSITALVLARRARDRVADGGSGQAVAALWIARIGVIAGVAAAVVFIALLAAGFDFEQFREDLERELEQRRDRGSDGVRTAVEGLRAVAGR